MRRIVFDGDKVKMKCYFPFCATAGVSVCQVLLAGVHSATCSSQKVNCAPFAMTFPFLIFRVPSHVHSPIFFFRTKCTLNDFFYCTLNLLARSADTTTCLRSNIKRASYQHNPATAFPLSSINFVAAASTSAGETTARSCRRVAYDIFEIKRSRHSMMHSPAHNAISCKHSVFHVFPFLCLCVRQT